MPHPAIQRAVAACAGNGGVVDLTDQHIGDAGIIDLVEQIEAGGLWVRGGSQATAHDTLYIRSSWLC